MGSGVGQESYPRFLLTQFWIRDMKKRLVLAACKDTHRTNWMRAVGSESEVVAQGIGDGDALSLVLTNGSDIQAVTLVNGSVPFPAGKWISYQVSKVAGQVVSPTTVEILMNGGNSAAYSETGNAVDP